jgi:plasmid segregation protein ParM
MDLGLDIGFYATKLAHRGGCNMFPSVVAHYAESMLDLDGKENLVLESDGATYMVGAEAIRKVHSTRKETASWIESPEWYTLFLAALSETSTATSAPVNLVTGLPVADYRRDKDTLRDRLIGPHGLSRRNRHRAQRFTVESVRIVPQGWGAVLYLLLDERGRIVQPELAEQRVAVLDVGGRNVGYLGIDGLSDLPHESRGTERGAWNVVRAIRDFIDTYHPGLSRLSDHALMERMTQGEVYDGNQRVDLEPVVGPLLDSIGQEIVDTAEQHWGAGAATYRAVIVCGGGAYLWRGMIQQAFPHAIVLPKPEFANAQGFYRFALHIGG